MKKRKCNKLFSLEGIENISYKTSVSEKTVVDDIIFDKSGFTSDIQFAGCTGEVTSQENHILSPKGGSGSGSVYPKNIVFQTDGSGNTFGSFFRDDTLTNPKGDVRGSGANDLSVSRELCSQVASGAFSSILSGENNTASSPGSIILGGDNNIADGSNCIVMGGLSNSSGGGLNNSIITGFQNQTIQYDLSSILIDVSNSLIMTGTNNIMNGNNSVFITGRDISGAPSTSPNNIPFTSCAIITGESNSIKTSVFVGNQNKNVFIGTGTNIKSLSQNVILTGSDIDLTLDLNFDILLNIIYTGRKIPNIFKRASFLCADTPSARTDNINSNGLLPGLSNRFETQTLGSVNGVVLGGINNKTSINDRSAIITGLNNNILTNNVQASSIVCTGRDISSGIFISPRYVNSFLTSTIITGSNHQMNNTSNSANGKYGYICGMRNGTTFITGLGVQSNILFGGGSNNTSFPTNSSIICGTDNRMQSFSASNSVIASGSNNDITGSNSFMTGIGGALSNPSSAVFGQSNLQGAIGPPSSPRIFMIGNGTGMTRNAFSVTENGVARANLTFVNGGADFAEYFEAFGSSIYRLPLHETVCLIDDRFIGKEIINKQFISSLNGFKESDIGKIILSSEVPDEILPFGVVTNNSSFIGNSYDDEWQGKYERDSDGRIIYEDKIEYEDIFDLSLNEIITTREERRISESGEVFYQKVRVVEFTEVRILVMEEVPVYNESGELLRTVEEPKKREVITKIKSKKISSQYNSNQIYVPRSKRPEWNLVALRGQVIIKKGQREIPDTIRLEEFGEFYDRYLI